MLKFSQSNCALVIRYNMKFLLLEIYLYYLPTHCSDILERKWLVMSMQDLQHNTYVHDVF